MKITNSKRRKTSSLTFPRKELLEISSVATGHEEET